MINAIPKFKIYSYYGQTYIQDSYINQTNVHVNTMSKPELSFKHCAFHYCKAVLLQFPGETYYYYYLTQLSEPGIVLMAVSM